MTILIINYSILLDFIKICAIIKVVEYHYDILFLFRSDFVDRKISHLNMIQVVISRMGSNSFALKGWSVGIMIAVYAFAGNSNVKAVIVTLMPLIVFWFIDAYYLMLERKYRCLYDDIRKKDEKEIDFSMNPNDVKIELNDVKKYGYFNIFFSKSVLPFYLVCIATTLVIYFVKF